MPNILLVSLDAVRADHLSCYGYARDTSPFLKRFVKEATLYEHAYTAARWTLPAHASLFTGMSNSKHGVSADWTDLQALDDTQVTTLAEFLGQMGYQTAAFSSIEWIGPKTKLDRGFQHFRQAWTLLDSTDAVYSYVERLPEKLKKNLVWRANYLYEKARRDKGARKTNRLLERWFNRISPERPFFAFLHYLEGHAKYWPPEPERSAFVEADAEAESIAERHVAPWAHLTGQQPISQDHLDVLAALYDGSLLYLDRVLAKAIGLIERLGVLDDTVIIITSDHGECFGEHGYYQHSSPTLHEPAIRVPLIIRYPRCFPRGMQVEIPVSATDIFPTITDVLGVTDRRISDQVQGESLVPAGDGLDRDHVAVVESLTTPESSLRKADPSVDIGRFDYHLRAVRWRNYKYIRHSRGGHELYDLSSDPGEMTNLVNVTTSWAAKIQKMLDRWLASFEHSSKRSEAAEDADDAEVRRRLAALGYLD
jgi:arylsulfatase A-like enzyme